MRSTRWWRTTALRVSTGNPTKPSTVTIIPVAKVRGRTKPGAEQAEVRLAARPVGVFVVKDGEASWLPAVDVTRIAVLGVLVGLVGTAFSTLAMVRRPPWPDLRGDVSRR